MEQLGTILDVADPVLRAALLAFALAALGAATRWLNVKTSDEKERHATRRLADLAHLTTSEAEQATVRVLKANGGWNADAAVALRSTVRDIVLRHLGEKGAKNMRKTYGLSKRDFNGLITSHIESAVSRYSGDVPTIKPGAPEEANPDSDTSPIENGD